MAKRGIIDVATQFSVDRLRCDADEIEACGGGNEAASMRWAADEIERLRTKLNQVWGNQCGSCRAYDDLGLKEFA